MANNYTDANDTNFKEIIGGVTYNIEAGKSLSAEGVRNALHTKENVANRQVSSTNETANVLDANSSDSYYPSSKLAGKNFAALRSGKQDKIAAGTANDILTKTTTAGTLGMLTKTTTLETNTTSASDEKIPTEKAVATALSGKASSGDVAAKQDKIEAGTANDILTKTTTAGTLSTLTKTTSIRTGSTIDTAPDDTRIPTEKAVADAVRAVSTAIENLSFQAALPIGTILMYDGIGWENNDTLKGWFKCDGYNGTPNLQDRFIMGSSTAPKEGGDNSVKIIAANLPSHTHTFAGEEATGYAEIANDGGTHNCQILSASGVFSSGPSASKTDATSGNRTTTGPFGLRFSMTPKGDVAGGGSADPVALDNRPSYYALIYIKKML
ncbi:hypothetical protein NO1_1638 [Candidatus Termititenax aidoneus]|uniref:Phage tail fiber protein n=1 Tax=Termititenax aidoneus TaxID=2218524 RepID=A0A388TC94_TERA1|nr:hypothetical protein NO1_1638 [Candidatus Termititenax aidoneus]